MLTSVIPSDLQQRTDWQDNADHNTPADIPPDHLRDRADTIEKEADQ